MSPQNILGIEDPKETVRRLTRKRKDELRGEEEAGNSTAPPPTLGPSMDSVVVGKDGDSGLFKPSMSTPPKKSRLFHEADIQSQPRLELWDAYGLNTAPCLLGNCSASNRTKCKNVYCLNRLGHDKWDSLLSKYKTKVDKEYPGRDVPTQPAGLKNLGNTCYLNSYLQVWYHLLPFRQAVYNWERLPQGFWASPADGSMDAEETMLALQHLFISLHGAPFESFSPKRIVNALKLNAEQQDALEFGQLFLSMLKDTVSQHSNGQEVATMLKEQFQGSCIQLTECNKCHIKSRRETPFTELTLGIQGHKNVASALSAYFAEETLEWRCGGASCSGNSGKKKVQFSEIPPILVLQLNRFIYDRDQGKKRKLQQALSFSRVLDVSPLMEEGRAGAEYELAAILVHQGASAYMGHYYALIEDQSRGKWYKFNDEEVTELTGKKIPGTEDNGEAGSSKAGNTLEAKGAYMLVYRRKGRRAEKRAEARLPPHCATVLNNLQEHYTRAKEDFQTARDGKIKRASDKASRMKELWKELQVKNPVSRADPLGFFPVEFLRKIQTLEVEDLGLKKETEMEGDEEIRILDVCEEICNGATPTPDYGEDPMDSLEMESSGRAATNHLKQSVDYEDKGVEMDLPVDEWKCSHGGIPLKDVREGKWRGVRVEGALRLLAAHCQRTSSDLLTGQDLCDGCVNYGLNEEVFKITLEHDADIVAKELRERKPDYCETELLPSLRKDFYWASRRDMNRFKGLAIEHGARKGQPRADEYLTDDASSDSDRMEGEESRTKTTGGLNGEDAPFCFNEDLICDHGMLSTEKQRRRVVSPKLWRLVKKYFPDAKEIRADTEECFPCQELDAGTEEEMKKVTQLRDFYFKYLDVLRREGLGRKMEGSQPGAFFYVVCREYFENWLAFVRNARGKGGAGAWRRMCNKCLLCDHGKVKYPLESGQYLTGPLSTVFSSITAGGQIDNNIPFVLLSVEEWATLCYPEGISEHFILDVDKEITASLTQEGVELTPSFCDECFAGVLNEKQNEQFRFSMGKIYVQKLGAEGAEGTEQGPGTSMGSSASDGSKIIPGMFNLLAVRRSTRRTRPKNCMDYIIDSDDTVQTLKVKIMSQEQAAPNDQHLTYQGEELEDLNKTLFDYRIPNGATLKLRVDSPLPEEEVMAQAERERARSPERGFQGSVLTQRK